MGQDLSAVTQAASAQLQPARAVPSAAQKQPAKASQAPVIGPSSAKPAPDKQEDRPNKLAPLTAANLNALSGQASRGSFQGSFHTLVPESFHTIIPESFQTVVPDSYRTPQQPQRSSFQQPSATASPGQLPSKTSFSQSVPAQSSSARAGPLPSQTSFSQSAPAQSSALAGPSPSPTSFSKSVTAGSGTAVAEIDQSSSAKAGHPPLAQKHGVSAVHQHVAESQLVSANIAQSLPVAITFPAEGQAEQLAKGSAACPVRTTTSFTEPSTASFSAAQQSRSYEQNTRASPAPGDPHEVGHRHLQVKTKCEVTQQSPQQIPAPVSAPVSGAARAQSSALPRSSGFASQIPSFDMKLAEQPAPPGKGLSAAAPTSKSRRFRGQRDLRPIAEGLAS